MIGISELYPGYLILNSEYEYYQNRKGKYGQEFNVLFSGISCIELKQLK